MLFLMIDQRKASIQNTFTVVGGMEGEGMEREEGRTGGREGEKGGKGRREEGRERYTQGQWASTLEHVRSQALIITSTRKCSPNCFFFF